MSLDEHKQKSVIARCRKQEFQLSTMQGIRPSAGARSIHLDRNLLQNLLKTHMHGAMGCGAELQALPAALTLPL